MAASFVALLPISFGADRRRSLPSRLALRRSRHYFPDGATTLFSQSVPVDTADEKRRLPYDVGIGYGDDIGRARGNMLDAIRGIEGVLTEPAPAFC